MAVSKNEMKQLYLCMRKIRRFEQRAATLFTNGHIPGFLHLYQGEEAIAAGVCANLREDDFITSTHRGHGHMIAKGGEMKYMMAELYGKKTGYCGGKGGSMHIADPGLGIVGANGIVGAGHDIAVGVGYSAQIRGTDQVCACFFGDASTNQGTFHESLNIASVWHLPIIYVCENNLYGVSTRQDRHMNIKNIADRAAAYGIPGKVVDGNDVLAVHQAAAEAVAYARSGKGPILLECKTYRHSGHFVGDPGTYKPAEEQAEWLAKDPLVLFPQYLVQNSICTQDEIDKIDADVEAELDAAIQFAEESPYPDPEDALKDVYSDIIVGGRER